MAKVSKPKTDTLLVRKALADEIGISERSLQTYLQIKEQGSPELLAAVQSGELKIGTAHKLLPKQIMKQLRQFDETFKFVATALSPETARQNGTDTNDPLYKENKQAIQAGLAWLAPVLHELINKLKERSAHETA